MDALSVGHAFGHPIESIEKEQDAALSAVVREYNQKIAELTKITADLPERLGFSNWVRPSTPPFCSLDGVARTPTSLPWHRAPAVFKSRLPCTSPAPLPRNHDDDGADVMGQLGEVLVDANLEHGSRYRDENTRVPLRSIASGVVDEGGSDEEDAKLAVDFQAWQSNDFDEELSMVASRWASLALNNLMAHNMNSYTLPLRSIWQLRVADADDSEVSGPHGQRSSVLGKIPLVQQMGARGSEASESMAPTYVGATRASGMALMRLLVRHPDGKFNRAYALLSTCIISFDVVMLPLVAFEAGREWKFVPHMLLFTAIFWSIDIVMSCFAGFYTESAMVEMRPRVILCNYIKTWFVFDFLITLMDWMFLFTLTEQANIFRVAKAMKVSRFFRALRVLRVAKALLYFQRYFITFASELTVVLANVVWTSILILVVNHYLACGWFALAYWNKDDAATWLKAHNGEDASMGMQYLMSYHWSITQFTPATNNIAPVNARERLFAVLTVLFALVMFSNFLSRLTTAMTEIHRINAASEAEKQSIKRFFITRNVSIVTANRIYFKKPQQMMLVSDVRLFGDLPSSAKRALYKDVFAVSLSAYPLFAELGRWGWSFFQAICSTALSEQLFNPGGEVFHKGDEACHMYLGTMGTLNYQHTGKQLATSFFCHIHSDGNTLSRPLTTPTIISEVALWSTWHHVGKLIAHTPCHLIRIGCEQFENVVDRKMDRSSPVFRSVVTYAARYIQYVSDGYETANPVTDVVSDLQAREIQSIAECAFRNPAVAKDMSKSTPTDVLYFAAIDRIRSRPVRSLS